MAQALAPIIIAATGVSGGTAAAIATAAAITDLVILSAHQKKQANDARKDAAKAPRDVTIRSAVEPARIIYGKARTSGPVVYTNTVLTAGTSDNSTLWTVISLANHECQSIEEIWLDGDQIDFTALSGTGGVQSGKYGPIGSNEVTNFYAKLGEDSQGAISALTSAFSDWTASHRGNNVTYIASAFELGTATGEGVWSQGAPRNIRAVVKGKKVYDPRLDSTQTGGSGSHRLADPTTWEWSDNPALCLADYLFDDRLGMGAEGITYNDIDWDMVADAATDCDATVTIPGGSEKRFTCNGVLSTGNTYAENVKSILSSMNGMMTWSGGKYRIRACAHEAASYTFTRDDIVGDVQIQPERTRSQRFNSVRGTYIDPDSDYNTVEFIPVTIDDYKTDRDNGESLYTNIGLPMTNSEYMAQRIAFKSVNLNNQQLTAVIPMNWRAMKVGVGDRITLNMSELFGSRTTFIVQNWSFEPDKGFVLTVREDASSAYNDPASDEYSTRILGGTVSFADQPVSAPSNLSATSEEEAILVEWTAPPRGSGYDEVVVYASASSSFSSASEVARTRSTSFRHELSNGTQRYYWIRSIDVDGEFSTRVPASDPSNIQATAGQINTSQLNDDDNFALTADWPSVTDSQGTAPDDNATDNGYTIDGDGNIAGSIDTATTGDIHGGQTGYDSGTGYFLGYDTNAYKFSIGNSSGDKLTFDGSNLAVTGNITADGGSIGGLTIGSNKIYLGSGTFNHTNTGFYVDNTGQFSLKDKLAFYPSDNTLRVKGNIEADVISVTDQLQVAGNLVASSLEDGSITSTMLTEEAINAIYDRIATNLGGTNGDYKETTGSFTTSGGTILVGTSSDKFDHGDQEVVVELVENYGFSQNTDYSGTALNATVQFQVSADGTFTDLTSLNRTQTFTLGKYDLSQYYDGTYIWYYGPRLLTTTYTAAQLSDNTDYQFRAVITSVGSAFTGQTYPVTLEVNEGIQGVTSAGGDANTLDGVDSTQFLRSDQSDTMNGSLTITGDLTVNGTTVTLNTSTLDVEDKNITLNYGSGDTSGSANGAGITIQDAVNSSTDATILWDATNDEFDFSHPINVGTLYAGNVQATGTIGNLTAGSLGQQMEKGDTSVTTLRFDADRWRLYAGNNAGEIISAYENGNIDFTTGNLLKNGTAWMDNSRNLSNLGTISSGAINSTGTSTFAGIRVNNSNTALSQGGGNSLRIQTNSGYVEVGPRNTGYAHFNTDRAAYYFEDPVHFDSQIYNYVSGGTSDPYWRAGNDGSGSGLDADLLDGQHASAFEPVNATILHQGSDIGSQDWNTFIDGTEASWNTVLNHSGSNRPSSAYTYGTALSFSKSGQAKLQIYAPETSSAGGTSAGMWYRTGWNTAYRDWQRIWDSGNDGSGSGLDADTVDGIQGANIFSTSTAPSGDVRIAAGNGYGLRFWDSNNYKIYMSSTGDGSWGGRVTGETTSDYNMYLRMAGGTNRGFVFRDDANNFFSINPDTGIHSEVTATFGPNPTWGKYLKIGGDANHSNANTASIGVTNGNLHIDSATSLATYLNYYDGTGGVAFGSGSNSVVAWMGPDGDLWKGGGDNTGSKYWHAGNDGSGSGLDADLLDGHQASQFMHDEFMDNAYVDFTVGGNADTYYPVSIQGGGTFAYQTYSITRGYAWAAPDTWNTSTHRGGLTLTWQYSGDGFWGGNDHDIRIIKFDETYSTMVMGMSGSVGGGGTHAGVVVWLRGGNAAYRFYGPRGKLGDVNVHLTSVTASNGTVFSSRTFNASTRDGELNPKYPIRNSSLLYDNNSRVWSAGNDGSGSGLDADTVDGIQGSNILRSDIDQTIPYYNSTRWYSNTNGASTAGSQASLEVFAPSANTDAFMTFHVSGDYAAYFGLDGTTNDLFWGGWSRGAAKYKIWHASNDGSGSGLDADLVDGIDSSRIIFGSNSTGTTSNTQPSQTLKSGFYDVYNNNTPTGTWYSFVNMRHNNASNNHGHQIAGSFYDNNLWNRNINNGSFGAWSKSWSSNNDGAGSGLDADLLDGMQPKGSDTATGANQVLRSHVTNGYLYHLNWINVGTAGIYSGTNSAHFLPNTVTSYGSWRTQGSRNGYDGIVFDHGGDVAVMFDASGNGGFYRQSGGGWFQYHHVGNSCTGFGGSTTSSSYEIYSSGAIYSTGNITAYSDARIKENVVTIDNALEIVEQMRGVYYNKIDDPEKRTEIGFIAQEVDAIEGAKPLVTYAEDVDQYGVSYGNTTALLVNAVKELSQQVKDLKAEMEALKNG